MLIAVSNRALCREPFLERVRKIAKEGRADYFILREKDLSHQDYLELARQCRDIFHGSNTRFLVHSDIRTAGELCIHAIHLPLSVFKEQFLSMPQKDREPFSLVGVSVHSVQEAAFVQEHGGDYVIVGHIFATDCKKGVPPRGLSFLEEVCQAADIPVYAIGGITDENMSSVRKAGAAGAAMMSAFML